MRFLKIPVLILGLLASLTLFGCGASDQAPSSTTKTATEAESAMSDAAKQFVGVWTASQQAQIQHEYFDDGTFVSSVDGEPYLKGTWTARTDSGFTLFETQDTHSMKPVFQGATGDLAELEGKIASVFPKAAAAAAAGTGARGVSSNNYKLAFSSAKEQKVFDDALAALKRASSTLKPQTFTDEAGATQTIEIDWAPLAEGAAKPISSYVVFKGDSRFHYPDLDSARAEKVAEGVNNEYVRVK